MRIRDLDAARLPQAAITAGLLGLAISACPTAAFADIRVMCYQDGNECDVTADLIKRYEAQSPGAKVILDVVPYKTVVEQLPIQLAAGQGPDIARVAEIGGLSKNYLDITPYVKDRKYWVRSAWTRPSRRSAPTWRKPSNKPRSNSSPHVDQADAGLVRAFDTAVGRVNEPMETAIV